MCIFCLLSVVLRITSSSFFLLFYSLFFLFFSLNFQIPCSFLPFSHSRRITNSPALSLTSEILIPARNCPAPPSFPPFVVLLSFRLFLSFITSSFCWTHFGYTLIRLHYNTESIPSSSPFLSDDREFFVRCQSWGRGDERRLREKSEMFWRFALPYNLHEV